MARRVITVEDIDRLLSQGGTELQLSPDAIVTALAQDHARDRGVRLVRGDAAPQPPAAERPAEPPAAPAEDIEADRALVRRAVVAVLGREPEGLDAVIARVVGEEQP